MNIFDVYPLFDVEPRRARGSWIWDVKGEKYLDFYGGHAVISIGHSHPLYVNRLSAQLQTIGFYSNSVKNTLQEQLAAELGRQSGYDEYTLFLCNSGAEANENAFKIASFHTGRKKIIAFEGSFHGRTSLAVSATDDPKIRALVNDSESVQFLPLHDEKALEEAINDETCAVIIEGIQGVAGINIPDPSFLEKIRSLCTQTGALMVVDEIQSGYGRSGKFFAHQHSSVRPDIITIAKGMGNGFPVAGVLIHQEVKAKHGMLGTTYGGNYLACVAGIAVLDVIRHEKLVHNALIMGDYIKDHLQGTEGIKEIRGQGLMIGIELEFPCSDVRNDLLKTYRIFTGSASNKHTIRLLPSLNICREEADLFLKSFKASITKHIGLCSNLSA